MQRKTGISRPRPANPGPAAKSPASAGAAATATTAIAASATAAKAGASGGDELEAWLAKYGPVEREVIEARERRLARRARRREESAWAFAGLCEATEGLAVVWRREGWSVREMVRWADGDVLTLLTLAQWLRRDATRLVDRARCRLRRPLYYAQERARREALAAERRRVGGRRTTNPCPTREAILDAWIHRRDSHETAVRFGSLVHDLECYVDNSLLRDEAGAITGRRGGVKAWLQVNIPALYVRYTTVMRYKAMAKRLRQVTGLADPVPAAAVLAPPARGGGYAEGSPKAGGGKRDYGADEIACKGRRCPPDGGNVAEGRADAPDLAVVPERAADVAVPDLAVVRARAVWLEVVAGVRGSATALMERLDALTDPERVEEANMLAGWRAKYENEITERMKSLWWRRMARKRDVG